MGFMLNTTLNLNELEDQYTSGVTVKRDIQIVRGEGAILFDADGNRYVDFVGGQGAANVGHGHLTVVAAIQEQSAMLISCPEFFHNPIRAEYQAALCQAAGMERVFLCNSGAEAVEAAIKFACLSTGRTGIISTMRGFHGRTIGALSTTWNKTYREPFAALLPDVDFVPYNNIERMNSALNENVAAVVLEVVQGEGGVHPADTGYLSAVQALCRENGTLLIIDEIQTGFGRTGSLFAFQDEDIQPDLVCLAKSIGGGIPMGAVLIGEQVGDLPPATHGSTFGGNPLACAAGLAVLEVLQSTDLISQVRERGTAIIDYLRQYLSDTVVRDVRGRGLLIGIELRGKVAPILRALQEQGILALPAGATVLRLLPPLVIRDEDLWGSIETIVGVINNATD
jgi:acetylornithine/LysW-gamma-L-lysine aminotransferase